LRPTVPVSFLPDNSANRSGQQRRGQKPDKTNLTEIKVIKEMADMLMPARSPVRSVSASFKEAL